MLAEGSDYRYKLGTYVILIDTGLIKNPVKFLFVHSKVHTQLHAATRVKLLTVDVDLDFLLS